MPNRDVIINALYRKAHKDRWPSDKKILLPSPGSFSHVILREVFDAGYESRASIPIDMVLHCPNCGHQHIDGAEPDICKCGHSSLIHEPPNEKAIFRCADYGCPCTNFDVAWLNPPHRSHLCHRCGTIWRPADVPTNGVRAIGTKGEKDTWPK